MRLLISKPVRSERIDCPLIVLRLITDAGDIANLLTSESIQALDKLRALPRGAYDHEKGVRTPLTHSEMWCSNLLT